MILKHPTVYGVNTLSVSETWNEGQMSRIQSVEMTYLWGAFGLNRMDGETNESMHGMLSMSFHSEGMRCGVMELVKHNILRWSGHLKRIPGDEIIKRIYKSGMDVEVVRGRFPAKCEDTLSECFRERGIENWQVSKVKVGNVPFCRGHPLGGVPGNKCQSRSDHSDPYNTLSI